MEKFKKVLKVRVVARLVIITMMLPILLKRVGVGVALMMI